jgi:uncharacterized protein YjbI with pentapeptide repeats
MSNVRRELLPSAVRSAESFDRYCLHDCSLAGKDLEAIEFEQSILASVDFSKSKLRRFLLRDVRLEKCDLANCRWTNANFDAVEWEKCRATGLQLLDSICVDSNFVGCKLDISAFHGSRFRGCGWENCDLREANFEGVEFADVIFRNCDLRSARFPNSTLKNVDLRGSYLAGLSIEASQLRGARVEPNQLEDLASTFGIIVEHLDESS